LIVRKTIDEDTTLNDASNIVAERLPEDWEIELSLSEGSGSVPLYNPAGHMEDYPCNFEEGIAEQMECALAHVEEQHAEAKD
jgi:hypothetical protein